MINKLMRGVAVVLLLVIWPCNAISSEDDADIPTIERGIEENWNYLFGDYSGSGVDFTLHLQLLGRVAKVYREHDLLKGPMPELPRSVMVTKENGLFNIRINLGMGEYPTIDDFAAAYRFGFSGFAYIQRIILSEFKGQSSWGTPDVYPLPFASVADIPRDVRVAKRPQILNPSTIGKMEFYFYSLTQSDGQYDDYGNTQKSPSVKLELSAVHTLRHENAMKINWDNFRKVNRDKFNELIEVVPPVEKTTESSSDSYGGEKPWLTPSD